MNSKGVQLEHLRAEHHKALAHWSVLREASPEFQSVQRQIGSKPSLKFKA